MVRFTILGSTGSVGISTLDVLARNSAAFSVLALTANDNVETLLAQCLAFKPRFAAMRCAAAAQRLREALAADATSEIEVLSGEAGICELAALDECDAVMSAIVGAAGLMPTLKAVQAGKRVLIANKEPLVMTGDLLLREAARTNATILPIDSEHNAIFQSLPESQSTQYVRRVHLTGSGGPFRGQPWNSLGNVTPAQACAHPNWSMGQKISVDSATMMNKGLELIEATALFALPENQIDVVIHPQSIIHSLVEYCDGSFIAQLGAPDMRIPIAHALAWPARIESGAQSLRMTDLADLQFSEPDMDNLPCLRLAREAAITGGNAPTILNAANEVAVEAFLQGKLRFTDIPSVIDSVLSELDEAPAGGLEDVLKIDHLARELAQQKLELTPFKA